MSRVGTKPVTIEEEVKVETTNQDVTVKGPLGELKIRIPSTVKVEVKDNQVVVSTTGAFKQAKSDHGTIRALIANSVKGVKEGYKKELELVGLGYRVSMEGESILMSIGWNHPVKVEPPEGIKFAVRDNVIIEITGIDKQAVGLCAAKIRSMRKPEPYKGKGIKYIDEVVRRKQRKAIKEEA